VVLAFSGLWHYELKKMYRSNTFAMHSPAHVTLFPHNKSLPKKYLLPSISGEIMSEARDRKMKRKRKLDELKAIKVMRACRFRRFDEIR
jgi:hypothetical protein